MSPWRSAVIDRRITDYLNEMGIQHAVIGAVALAVHGAPRYSADIDLMVLDKEVLNPNFWAGSALRPCEIRRGDWDDPIAGLVKFPTSPGDTPTELVIGKGYAASLALNTAEENHDLECPVVSPLGLALLKLEAGGTKDIHDLLALDEAQRVLTRWDLTNAVEPHLFSLSRDAMKAWERFQTISPSRSPSPTREINTDPEPLVPPKKEPGRSR